MRPAVVVGMLAVAAGLMIAPAGLSSHAADCTPTPSNGGGPDRSPPLRAKIGTGHVLTGVVLTPACTPVKGARVSFWQAGKNGIYRPSGAGAVVTTASGRFRFEGPRPTPYEGRPGHIHIKVQAAGFELLFTTYFPPQGSRRGNLRLVLTPSAL